MCVYIYTFGLITGRIEARGNWSGNGRGRSDRQRHWRSDQYLSTGFLSLSLSLELPGLWGDVFCVRFRKLLCVLEEEREEGGG